MKNSRTLPFSPMPVLACIALASLARVGVGAPPPAAGEQVATTPATGSAAQLKKLSLEDLMGVEVSTVSRSESTVGESPAAVFVVTPEMIRRSGANSIAEALRMVPGMQVATIDASKWGIGSRGFTERFVGKMLVQIDGRTLYNPINAGVYWDTVDYPLEDIERIEVVRGPGGSVWGANAVNGVINIITKPAKDTQGGLVSGGSGSEERGFATFRFGGQMGENIHYRAYAKWFERDNGFNLFGDARDDWRQARTGLRFDWTPQAGDTVTLQGEYYRGSAGRRDLRASPALAAPSIVVNTEDEESFGGNVVARWTHELGKDSNWTLQATYDYFDRHGTAGTFDFTVHTIDVDFQHQFPIGDRQKVVWGTAYRLNEILFKGSVPFDRTAFAIGPREISVSRNLFSAFVQDEIKIVPDRFSVIVGSKFEHNDFTGFELQPTGRLLWTPSSAQTVWAAVSRAVRTPSVLENDIQLATLPSGSLFPRIFPNRDLDSEKVVAYELGWRAQVARRFSFDLALFYNEYSDLFVTRAGIPFVDPATGARVLPINRTNGAEAETYGAEITATWQPTDWWRIFGSYTFLKMNIHADRKLAPAARPGTEVAIGEGKSPQNQFYLRSSWDLPGRLELDLIGRYVDNLPGFTVPGLPPIKAYTQLDARLAWKPRDHLELAIVGQNLLNEHTPEFGTSILVRSPLVESERAFYGKVTWNF